MVTLNSSTNGALITPTRVVHCHDNAIKWKHFTRYWPFVRGFHRSPANSSHKGQWRGDLMFPLICAWINVWANNREAGVLRRHCAHYDVIVMVATYLEGVVGSACAMGVTWDSFAPLIRCHETFSRLLLVLPIMWQIVQTHIVRNSTQSVFQHDVQLWQSLYVK